ncbi:MAG: hypothetical protein ACREEM_21545 [Blastocatellia bacterium]
MVITQKQKAYLIISITFLLGVIVGVSGYYLLSPASAPSSTRTVASLTSELTKSLHLDPEQKAQVEAILNDSKRQYQSVKDQMQPQVLSIREATRKRVRDLLLEEQKPLFDQWTRELDAKREREKKAAEEK